MYGSGPSPVSPPGDLHEHVYLLNQQYWEINDLEVTNTKASVGTTRASRSMAKRRPLSTTFTSRTASFTDVTGEVMWIGGSTADNAPGITFQAGWDASKKTGGIVFRRAGGDGHRD